MARRKSRFKKFLAKFKYFPGEPSVGFEGDSIGIYVRWPNSIRAFLVPGIGFDWNDEYIEIEFLFFAFAYFRG